MNRGPVLSLGSTGPDVRRLQRLLVMLHIMGFEGIDGSFGPSTRQHVQEYQRGEGLAADGICGPQTWAALPADPRTPLLRKGSTGSVVESMQRGLLIYGGAGSPTDPGPVDGIFGPSTEHAVRSYQGKHGIAVDGIVGDRTWWVPAGAAGATLASLAEVTTA